MSSRRRVAPVDPESISMDLSVFVAVEAGANAPEWLERFSKTLDAMPEVMEIYRMAGEVYPVHVIIRKSVGLMTRKLSVTWSQ